MPPASKHTTSQSSISPNTKPQSSFTNTPWEHLHHRHRQRAPTHHAKLQPIDYARLIQRPVHPIGGGKERAQSQTRQHREPTRGRVLLGPLVGAPGLWGTLLA